MEGVVRVAQGEGEAMNKQQLEAIRARDRDYDDIFAEQARMSPEICHRLVAWPVADRRALLGYVDELREELNSVNARAFGGEVASRRLSEELAALRADADARSLYDRTASAHGFSNAPPWSELAEETRQMYRDARAKRDALERTP